MSLASNVTPILMGVLAGTLLMARPAPSRPQALRRALRAPGPCGRARDRRPSVAAAPVRRRESENRDTP